MHVCHSMSICGCRRHIGISCWEISGIRCSTPKRLTSLSPKPTDVPKAFCLSFLSTALVREPWQRTRTKWGSWMFLGLVLNGKAEEAIRSHLRTKNEKKWTGCFVSRWQQGNGESCMRSPCPCPSQNHFEKNCWNWWQTTATRPSSSRTAGESVWTMRPHWCGWRSGDCRFLVRPKIHWLGEDEGQKKESESRNSPSMLSFGLSNRSSIHTYIYIEIYVYIHVYHMYVYIYILYIYFIILRTLVPGQYRLAMIPGLQVSLYINLILKL